MVRPPSGDGCVSPSPMVRPPSGDGCASVSYVDLHPSSSSDIGCASISYRPGLCNATGRVPGRAVPLTTRGAHPRSREEAEETGERSANAARQEVYREVSSSRVGRAAPLEYVVHVALVETHDDRQAVAETVKILRRIQQVVPIVGKRPQIE